MRRRHVTCIRVAARVDVSMLEAQPAEAPRDGMRGGGETFAIEMYGHEVTVDLSLARRLRAARERPVHRYRLTGDGDAPLTGARAEGQRAADAQAPMLMALVMQVPFLLEDPARMHEAPGMPRYFPVVYLEQEEVARCVVPASQRAFRALKRVLGS